MKVRPEEAAKVAKLARLRLDEDKLAAFAEHMHNILTYMETLNAVDTTEVAPLYSPVEHTNVTRPDVVTKTCSRDEVLRNAPETDGQYFVVPKII